MARSTGIVLLTGGITFSTHYLADKSFDWKVIPATGVAALGLMLLESLNQPLAVGIAIIAMVTVLFAGVGGKPSPAAILMKTMGYGPNGKKG